MKTFLGVDGGGSKTRFVLIDERGEVLASHLEGTAYYIEIGLDATREMLVRGIRQTLEQAGVSATQLTYAFVSLPSYGEDQSLIALLDALPSAALPSGSYRCDNDMVCAWAGALAGADGITVASGTGSIAYGEFQGRTARAGGWGELFSDEGSSYWLAREGLRLFSRMSDGRTARGPLYEHIRRHFKLEQDLDLCAAIYGEGAAQRSQLAQLSQIVTRAAAEGDEAAADLIRQAAAELADLVDAVAAALRIPSDMSVPVSYTGGMFRMGERLTAPLHSQLLSRSARYRVQPPRFPPEIGAALQAARLDRSPLSSASLAALDGAVARLA